MCLQNTEQKFAKNNLHSEDVTCCKIHLSYPGGIDDNMKHFDKETLCHLKCKKAYSCTCTVAVPNLEKYRMVHRVRGYFWSLRNPSALDLKQSCSQKKPYIDTFQEN